MSMGQGDKTMQILDLAAYDWIIINSSAGKDSQAMLDYLVKMADEHGIDRSKLVVAHADLGRCEWQGTKELAIEQAAHYGLRFEVETRPQGDLLDHVMARFETLQNQAAEIEAALEAGDESLISKATQKAIERKRNSNPEATLADLAAGFRAAPPWFSSAARYCTSDHKRGQISKVHTMLAKESKAAGHTGQVRILNAMGLRGQESTARAKKAVFVMEARTTVKGNEKSKVVDQWLSIHDWTEEQVWDTIRASGVRHHFAYDLGMSRLSCVYCIFAPKAMLMIAGKHNPELLDQYVEVERRVGFKFRQDLALEEIQQALAGDEVALKSVSNEDINAWTM